MHSTWALASLLAASAQALPEIAITKHGKPSLGTNAESTRARVKRAGTLGTNIYDVLTWSDGGAYYANITVGTPPQPQVVILDTGSSDLYFDATSAAECQTTGADSCQGGTFDPTKSSTYKVIQKSPAFNTSFGDGSGAFGPYSQDTVAIGDVSISNVEFGVADSVSSTTGYAIGLMGVGYSENEATVSVKGVYPNIPEVLVDSGVINSRLYSIYLNDQDDISGSILFGGIDTSKFSGDLATLDLLPTVIEGENLGVFQFVTTVTAVNATVNGKTKTLISGGTDGTAAYKSSDPALPVLLDTGSTDWSVPSSTYNKLIAPAFSYIDANGLCPCSHADSQDSLSLTFGGKVNINIPAREFIVPYYNTTTREPISYPGTNEQACLFLISPSPSSPEGFLTLGDAILRSMYVVFDLDNGQVSIAQAADSSKSSPNVVTVSAGPSGVANAVSGVATAPSNTQNIDPKASATAQYSVSTLASTIGTATGIDAVPTAARPLGTSSYGGASGSSGSGSGSGSGSTSKGAAAPGIAIPGGAHFSVSYISAVVLFAAVIGAAGIAL